MSVLVFLTCVVVTTSTLIRPYHGEGRTFTSENLVETLDALEKLLQYFDANRGSLIVDSMWGIRMIQGKFNCNGSCSDRFVYSSRTTGSGLRRIPNI